MSSFPSALHPPIMPQPARSPAIRWIGKAAGDGSGEEILDRKVLSGLRRLGVRTSAVGMTKVSRGRELANLLRGVPYYRARFLSADNLSRVNGPAGPADGDVDFTVISWEPLDFAARSCAAPTVLLLHNVSSDAIRQMQGDRGLAGLLARGVERWERSLYCSRAVAGIVVLSDRDAALVRDRAPHVPIAVLPPGMPPLSPLPPGTAIRQEIVVSGTYDWKPKHRDMLAFAREWAAGTHQAPVLNEEALPPEIAGLLNARPFPRDGAAAIRFGLVADRFLAGHKLKSTAYVAANCIVLSYCDIRHDFAGLPDADMFIRHVRHADEIAATMAALAALPAQDVHQRFERFRNACARRFSWEAFSQTLLDFCGSLPPHGPARWTASS